MGGVMYLDERIHRRIVDKKMRLDGHRPLNQAFLERIRKELMIEYTYDSNAIEGSTLSLHETRMVIEEGVTIGEKPLKDVLSAKNHPEAIDCLVELVQLGTPLTEKVVLTLHTLVMKDIKDDAGSYRDHGVRVAGATFQPAKSGDVPRLIKELVDLADRNMEELSPLELAAVFHHRFVQIHPFSEGNGRTARLIMNLMLMQRGYPFIINITNRDRDKYIRGLREADHGNRAYFVNFIARSAERVLDIYLNAIEEPDILSLKEASELTPYSQEYLSLLARRGRIGAFKEGRNWYISMRELNRYMEETGSKGTPEPQ